MNSRQGLSRNKISNFSDINSWKHFSGSAIILVPAVIKIGLNLRVFFCPQQGPWIVTSNRCIFAILAEMITS